MGVQVPPDAPIDTRTSATLRVLKRFEVTTKDWADRRTFYVVNQQHINSCVLALDLNFIRRVASVERAFESGFQPRYDLCVKPVTDQPTGTPRHLGDNNIENALMASIVASSDDAILSESLDGIINSWNPAAERMYGYSAEEIIGQPFSMLLPPGQADEGAEILLKIRNGQRIERFETLRIRKDGSPVLVSLTISPIRDSTGVLVGAASITRDLTARDKAEHKFRDILESTPDAMIIVDNSGTIVIVNSQAEKIFGYSQNEMLGQKVEFLIPSRFHAKHLGHRDVFIAHSRVRPMGMENADLCGLRKDGREFPVEISLSPIETADGILVAAAVRDATDHKQMIRRMEEMNELRNEFVAVVAHDLRAPMMSISGFAHLLSEQWNVLNDDEKIQYAEIIARNTDGLSEFVEDVLQVARMEAGEYSYDIHPLDIRLLIQNSLENMAGEIGGSRFSLIAPDELPLVLGDKDRQTQILTNLLSNAVKFSPANEPVVVSLSCVGDFVEVSITDRGIGIAKDDLAKLFRKSGRVFRPGDQKTPGNGLGLYICRTLVEAQGGRIWCESIPDQGSTFFFTIPLVR